VTDPLAGQPAPLCRIADVDEIMALRLQTRTGRTFDLEPFLTFNPQDFRLTVG
jgi:hypothetical protein